MSKITTRTAYLTMSVLLLVTVCTAAVGKTIYVDDDATGANDGTSWTNAYNYLQDALTTTVAGDEIWVAQGIYKPNQGILPIIPPGEARGPSPGTWPSDLGKLATFALTNDVTIKGGYAGFDESDPNSRDIELYKTILSGDILGDDVYVGDPCDLLFEPTRADNVHIVVIGSNVDETAVLDGFTITGGHETSINMGFPTGGAGMHIYQSSPTILNCMFTGNAASHVGGGMYNRSSNPTLINCRFIQNFADSGGAMCNLPGQLSTEGSDPILIDCTFDNNYALQYGGGMDNFRSNPTLTDCKFSHNRAVWPYSGVNHTEGGGMYNRLSSPELSNCEFNENLADFGGGICNADESNIVLTNCTFRGNSASYGGGLLNPKDCSSTLTDCKFIDNIVIESGGGISNGSSNTTLINCIFKGNKAKDWSMNGVPPSRGGGMITGGNPILNNCTFQENCAVEGAGILIGGGPKLTGCTFTGNSAENDGGAICNEGTSSEPDITNCIFTGNSANRGGGVFFTWGAKMTMANCTFVGNLASSGNALASNPIKPSLPGYIQLTNCILWDGENAILDPDPYALSSAITYSNVQGGWEGEGNIDIDPLFAETGYWSHIDDPNIVAEPNDPNAVWIDGDYHLKSQAGRWDPVSKSWVMDDVTSPCIDGGDPNSPVGDEPEPNGGRINIGAYGGTAEASKSDYTWWFATTDGPVAAEGLGIILPHEHIFTDLRGPTSRTYGQAEAADVVRVMAPLLEAARQKGVGLLIECSSIGVGRNVSIISQVAATSGLPVVVPTGVYGRANFAPAEHRNMSEDELMELFISEIREGIEDTGIKAGFIKIATGNSTITALEEKFLRAAGRAARETGAAVASHTPRGSNATRQADILESISPVIRFIWVHAQNESNRSLHRQLAARGVFIELDSLGWNPGQDSTFIAAIKELLATGYGEQILLSHDAGWYQPGEQNGGTQKPYTYLVETFIPKLRNAGVDEEAIRMITESNPVRAFGFKQQ